MKTSSIIALACICALTSCAHLPIIDKVEKRAGLYYAPNASEPFTGTVLESHTDGSRKSETRFQKGRHHGKRTTWHPNGQKALEQVYVRGKLSGHYIRWYPSGQKQEEFWLAGEGYDDRGAIKWHENGQIWLKETLSAGQSIMWEMWYKNGNLTSKTYFKNGKRHGPETFWTPSGNKHVEHVWADGKLLHKFWWDENGTRHEGDHPIN